MDKTAQKVWNQAQQQANAYAKALFSLSAASDTATSSVKLQHGTLLEENGAMLTAQAADKSADLAGATILPANPSFYTRPQTIEQVVDTVVARVLDHLGVAHNLVARCKEERE